MLKILTILVFSKDSKCETCEALCSYRVYVIMPVCLSLCTDFLFKPQTNKHFLHAHVIVMLYKVLSSSDCNVHYLNSCQNQTSLPVYSSAVLFYAVILFVTYFARRINVSIKPV